MKGRMFSRPLFFAWLPFTWFWRIVICVVCARACGYGHACICVNSGFVLLASFLFCYFCFWSYLLPISTKLRTSHCLVSWGRFLSWQNGRSFDTVCGFACLVVCCWFGCQVCRDMSLPISEMCACILGCCVSSVGWQMLQSELGVASENRKAAGYARIGLKQERLACTIWHRHYLCFACGT